MLQRHFRTLEIAPTTDKKAIRNAYRKLAKKYHPDISQEVDAHDRFVEVSIAYEKILERLNRPAPRVNAQSNQTRRQQYREHVRKTQRKRRDPRERAEQHSRMRYRDFEKNQAQPDRYPIHTKIILGFCGLLMLYPFVYMMMEGAYGAIITLIVCVGSAFWAIYSLSMYVRRKTNRPW